MITDRELFERSKGFVHYRGRPAWVTEEVLDSLNTEAARLRGTAEQVERQAHAPVGAVGQRVGRSSSMLDLIAEYHGHVKPSGNANYLYYDCPGAGIDPHMDSPDFPLQILLMLGHTGLSDERSSLVVFPDGPKGAIPIVLNRGEMVLFSAGSIYHGRTAIGEGESITLLGIGYVGNTP